MRLAVLALALLLAGDAASAAAKRVLFLTATAGFRHSDSIDASVEVMGAIADESDGALEIVHTEDTSLINASTLGDFDAVWFFTSGELPFTDQQKADLLAFVRGGKGFGGSHSATDTLYSWPDYGELIGAYFDGHPWTQEANVDVEDPENPTVAHMAPSFRTLEEFYQFRAFSRDRVRVLLTLDTRSVDLKADGVNRADGDFALAWVRRYGEGRVFYGAFGHFPDSFRQPVFRRMLSQALLWITGQIELDATPRSGPSTPAPAVAQDGVRNLAGTSDVFAPGSLVSIRGRGLTSGSSDSARATPLPVRLAGTHVEVEGTPAPLLSVSPEELIAQVPFAVVPGRMAALTVSSVDRAGEAVPVAIVEAAPRLLGAARVLNSVVLYAVGLGKTIPEVAEGMAPAELAATAASPVVRVGGQPVTAAFAGLAPGLVGIYLVTAALPPGAAAGPVEIMLEAAGQQSNTLVLQP